MEKLYNTMKCLRCGYCCIMYDVIIIDPIDEFIKNVKTIDEIPEKYYKHKPHSQKCPHLQQVDKIFKCTIHDYTWYKETPCANHTQIGKGNCRLGEYMFSHPEIYNKILEKVRYLYNE